MEYTAHYDGFEARFVVRGALLHTAGPQLSHQLRKAVALANAHTLTLDLSRCSMMDSLALYALADFCRWLDSRGDPVLFEVIVNA
ncbi:MAG: hypothetical protein KatS3mg115_2311 [Candidatus Poribacteria bacterium]|nr:MAG: hypothetical protein KatS3mg115_2311 [Candidatus Poribacteria bacterium]